MDTNLSENIIKTKNLSLTLIQVLMTGQKITQNKSKLNPSRNIKRSSIGWQNTWSWITSRTASKITLIS
jgi:hypothetical protein